LEIERPVPQGRNDRKQAPPLYQAPETTLNEIYPICCVVELGLAESISPETAHSYLKKRPQTLAKAGVVHSRSE
jgi:hypothetical protein